MGNDLVCEERIDESDQQKDVGAKVRHQWKVKGCYDGGHATRSVPMYGDGN